MSDHFQKLAKLSDKFEALDVHRDEEQPDRIIAAMNRPEVLNAIDQTMVNEFHALCHWPEDHPSTLIITGTTTPHPHDPTRQPAALAAAPDTAQLRDRRDEIA